MYLKSIQLENYRNHSSTIVECSRGINFLLGNNGEGKTNIIEAISTLCLTKSFFGVSDSIVLKTGEKKFRIVGKIISDCEIDYMISIDFEQETRRKNVLVNKTLVEKASLLIGQFPVIILTPEQNAITFGAPTDRRRFIDFVIAQSSRAYLENLIDYRRILKQRNKILTNKLIRNIENLEEIEIWNESLINIGASIIKKRIEFIKEFQDIIVCMHKMLSGSDEIIEVLYEPSCKIYAESEDEIKRIFKEEIVNNKKIEYKIGHTIVGPHRDEIIFKINGLHAKNYASQGQHKTLLVSLKLAEFYYIKEKCKETPILLLDDVLSELDLKRGQRLLEATSELGQIFITTTDERAIDRIPVTSATPKKFYVKKGSIDRIENAICSN